MRSTRMFAVLGAAATVLAAGSLGAQTPAHDVSARLREVLPADVAERVISRIADARARQLPAAALENRALKFAAKGVAPSEIESSVAQQAEMMAKAKDALGQARSRPADAAEVEAGAEALREGVDGAAVSALAQSAPPGRSLAVPLFVIGGLVDRGLPSDAALKSVQERLQSRASDAELRKMVDELPAQAAAGQARRPAVTGRPAGVGAGARPAGVPTRGTAGAPGTLPGPGGIPSRP